MYLHLLLIVTTIVTHCSAPEPSVIFLEQFTSKQALDSWTLGKSQAGEWKIAASDSFSASSDDFGLLINKSSKHYGLSKKLGRAINARDAPLILQYEVKTQKGLECGGAYVKLLTAGQYDALENLSGTTPYSVMFGPDRCGSSDKVHLILRHRNPKSGEIQEKHLKNPPKSKDSDLTVLYTLIIRPDNTFEIKIDNEQVRKGSLLKEFEPSVNPPEYIDDPLEKKPNNWEDDKEIPDTEAKKPEDWDENEPEYIPDPEAKKPEGWLEEEQPRIPHPEHGKQPEDWNEEEDGPWYPPETDNPKCIVGCGPWAPPLIKNTKYKGKWSPKMIPNPKFKGVWKARQVKNPNYYKDAQPAAFTPVDAVAFELWTVQDGILFDNILLCTSEDYARSFALQTWGVKHEKERAAQIKKAKEGMGLENPDDDSTPSDFAANAKQPLKETLSDAWEELLWFSRRFKRNPFRAIRSNPLLSLNIFFALFIIASAVQKLTSKLSKKTPNNKVDEPPASVPIVEASAPLNPTSSPKTAESVVRQRKQQPNK